MITTDIVVELNLGQHEKIKAVITPDAFSDITREFKESSDWKYFQEYCDVLTKPDNSALVPAPFIQKFDKTLTDIIEKHTKYHVSLFWPVIDAMFEQGTGRKPW